MCLCSWLVRLHLRKAPVHAAREKLIVLCATTLHLACLPHTTNPLQVHKNRGILLIAAAGNEKANLETSDQGSIADYSLDNIIGVAASTPDDVLASFSNWSR